MNTEEKIQKINDFKTQLKDYNKNPTESTREKINQEKRWIEREVLESGCMKLFTATPPPAMGGLIHSNLNPFDIIFNPPYRLNIIPHIIDILDETIGAIAESPHGEMISEPKYQEGYAFIAMAMDPSDNELEDIHEAIKSCAIECGILAERIDEDLRCEKITDRILESIKKAQFIIVDLTHSKTNVYFEAGYAHGINKIPIYLAKKDTNIEFDIKDYPVVFYKNLTELKKKLKEKFSYLVNNNNKSR
jgi:hypothetical protein